MQEQLYRDIHDAELTHWWFRGRLRIVTSLIRRLAPSSRPLSIADVGCGVGASLQALSVFGRVVGVDPSDTALRFSSQRGHRLLVSGALPSLPFQDEGFDVVCALDVIEHLDEDRAAVVELWRVCRPGGLLVVTVPAHPWLWSEHDDVNDHKRRYTRDRLRECLALPGGEIARLSFFNVLLAPPIMLYRLARNAWRRPRRSGPARSDVFRFPAPLNAVLETLFSSEAWWLQHGAAPFGSSLVGVVRKKLP